MLIRNPGHIKMLIYFYLFAEELRRHLAHVETEEIPHVHEVDAAQGHMLCRKLQPRGVGGHHPLLILLH